MNRRPLRGVIPAVLTPMTRKDGSLDHSALERSLSSLLRRGVDAVFIGGTMGEGPLLTLAERKSLAESAINAIAGQVPVAIHVGALGTAESVELAAHALASGADAVAAVPPFYYGYGDAELLEHFVQIAKAAAPLPFYLYNLPAYCRNHVSPDLLLAVANRASNVAGIKESSGDPMVLKSFLANSGGALDIICGADHLIAQAVAAGAVGAVSSGAAVFPELYIPMFMAKVDAKHSQQATINAMQAILGQGTRVARYKECWRLQGLDLGTVRPPAGDVSDVETSSLRTAFAEGALPTFSVS